MSMYLFMSTYTPKILSVAFLASDVMKEDNCERTLKGDIARIKHTVIDVPSHTAHPYKFFQIGKLVSVCS